MNKRGLELHTLPRWFLRILLATRNLLLYAIEPLDYVSRIANDKRHLPPLALRRSAGPLRSLESSGGEFLAYLKLLCQLSPQGKVLDVGCGFGLMALYLEDYLKPPGTYVGLDIDRKAIMWAESHITRRYPHFRFLHIDIRNTAYNPKGTHSASDQKFPFGDREFDLILMKSVFTHMPPPEVENYIREVARLLAPGGLCLATCFLLNAVQGELQQKGQNSIDFKFGDGVWCYAWREIPELAAAYRTDFIRHVVQETGLIVKNIFHGTWSGRADGLSYQDMILISHKRRAV